MTTPGWNRHWRPRALALACPATLACRPRIQIARNTYRMGVVPARAPNDSLDEVGDPQKQPRQEEKCRPQGSKARMCKHIHSLTPLTMPRHRLLAFVADKLRRGLPGARRSLWGSAISQRGDIGLQRNGKSRTRCRDTSAREPTAGGNRALVLVAAVRGEFRAPPRRWGAGAAGQPSSDARLGDRSPLSTAAGDDTMSHRSCSHPDTRLVLRIPQLHRLPARF